MPASRPGLSIAQFRFKQLVFYMFVFFSERFPLLFLTIYLLRCIGAWISFGFPQGGTMLDFLFLPDVPETSANGLARSMGTTSIKAVAAPAINTHSTKAKKWSWCPTAHLFSLSATIVATLFASPHFPSFQTHWTCGRQSLFILG